MANKEQLNIFLQGVQVWNAWREANRQEVIDLSGADLSGRNFHRAYLRKANLSGTNFHAAHLCKATLSKANLTEANLCGACIRSAHLREANLSKANLSKADLSYSNLVDADLNDTNLFGCSIYGISAWSIKGRPSNESNLIITNKEEHVVLTVDDLELAQFIHLLINHRKLRNVINSVTEKGVLILGRFDGGGIEMLREIASKLREFKYLPIIFDFDRPKAHDYTETIKTLTGFSRFVIADLSGPSVPHELSEIIPSFKTPLIPIIESGRDIFATFPSLLAYPWVISPVEFTSV